MAAAIRFNASASNERGQAKFRRMKPSPADPKIEPGDRATFAFSTKSEYN